MKKIITLILGLTMIFTMNTFPVSASSYVDVAEDSYYKDAVENLSIYGIISGYNGYFKPENNITRAEFSKIAAISGGFEKEVAGKAGNTRFNDVERSHWANGYINAASENLIIVGYPNGNFMPENNITYQEAVTIILRLMDYTSDVLGDNWPYAYMEKGRSLGLLDGISKSGTDLITRGDVCLLLDRALRLDLYGSDTELFSKLDIKTTDEVLVIATKNEDKSLEFSNIKTSGGNYELANENVKITPLTKVKLILNSDGKVINSIPVYTPKIVTTTIETVTEDIVYFGNGANSKSLSIKDSTLCYYSGKVSSFADVKGVIEEGTQVSFAYEKDGSLGYVVVSELNYSEPLVVRVNAVETLDALGAKSDSTIIRDGLKSSIEQIKLYDVCYYQSGNNTVYVYSDKISGVYEEAYPSKASVSSVIISGVTLEIETQTAAYKLGEKSGSYSLNSRVTALLGKDGKVVDVVDVSASSASFYGVILSVESKMEDNTQETYINVLTGNGVNVSYKTLGNYSKKIGCVGKISFNDEGYAQFTTVSENLIYGDVDNDYGKIGSKWISGECKIIELLYVPENNTGTAKAQVIKLSDLGETLSKSQCVFAATGGEFGDIVALFVTDVTGDAYEYGVLKSGKMTETENDVSGNYEIFTESGKTESMRMDSYINISAGAGVKMIRDGNTIVSIKALSTVKSGAKCLAFDYSRIKVGNSIYAVSSNAVVAVQTSSGYRRISVEDAQEYVGKAVRVYTDSNSKKSLEAKVIVFENR